MEEFQLYPVISEAEYSPELLQPSSDSESFVSYKCLMGLRPGRRVFFSVWLHSGLILFVWSGPVSPQSGFIPEAACSHQPILMLLCSAAAAAAAAMSSFPSSHSHCGSRSCLQGSSVSAQPLLNSDDMEIFLRDDVRHVK